MTRPAPDDLPVRSALEELGGLSFAEHSFDSFLQRTAEVAGRLLAGRAAASITVLRHGRFSTAAASDELATHLDLVQYRQGSGPCVQAATSGAPVDVADLRSDPRWSAFASAALERGVLTVHSHPLAAPDDVRAGLNLYAQAPRADGLIQRLAAAAVVPVSNMYLYRSAVERAEHLEVALDSRGVIDQAKGILMERFRLNADQAFQVLARLSMERNVRVREVADRLVRTGELPHSAEPTQP